VPEVCCKAFGAWTNTDDDTRLALFSVCDKIARQSAATIYNLCESGIVETLSLIFLNANVSQDAKARAMHLTALLSVGDLSCMYKIAASPMFTTSTRNSPYSIRLTHMVMLLNVAAHMPMATMSTIITDDTLQSLAEFMKGSSPPQQVTVLALKVIERLLTEDRDTWFGQIDAMFANIVHRLAMSHDPIVPKTAIRTERSISEMAGSIVDHFFNE
jgi:hypothetical protein